MKHFFCLFGLLIILGVKANAQTIVTEPDTVKIMQYNLLRFPGTTGAVRMPLLTQILNYAKPHLFTINELSVEAGADQILNQALNINGENRWKRAKFVRGPDPYNMLYYRSDLFGLVKTDSILSAPRYTTGNRLFYKDPALGTPGVDTTWLSIYQMHLLSSTGATNEAGRNTQCQALVSRLNTSVTDSNVFLTGDFNVYKSAEPSYQTLLSAGPFQFFDPINKPGAWSSNPSFADIHTQSPRVRSFGGGATGGLDDRFDFILTTKAPRAGTHRITTLPSTYTVIGNDGQHFNDSLSRLPNGQVSNAIAMALYNMSDHLPVTMKMVVQKRSLSVGLAQNKPNYLIKLTSNPQGFTLGLPEGCTNYALVNQLGQTVWTQTIDAANNYQTLPSNINRGVYYLLIQGKQGLDRQRIVWF
jgi:hypothetical protein